MQENRFTFTKPETKTETRLVGLILFKQSANNAAEKITRKFQKKQGKRKNGKIAKRAKFPPHPN